MQGRWLDFGTPKKEEKQWMKEPVEILLRNYEPCPFAIRLYTYPQTFDGHREGIQTFRNMIG